MIDLFSAVVNGRELNFANLSAIQSEMGVCLQRDIFWDSLTVQEHFELFLRLRKQPLDSMADTIRSFDLQPDQQASTLSGGQKRKLNLVTNGRSLFSTLLSLSFVFKGIALVGEPALVILDEPSAGVSVNAQMQIWQILREYQLRATHSTVLLTTHDMDEAEVFLVVFFLFFD